MKKFFCLSKNDFCEDFMNCEGCEHFKDLGGERREAPKTNADHIRSMSNKDLAELLMDCCRGATHDASECDDKICVYCRMDWLEQPYKENSDV